jgi:HJR/Mrr/RecB family endonuclease
MSMPPFIDTEEMPETRTRVMKKPVPEDFGLINQQYNEVKERMARTKTAVAILVPILILGSLLGSLIVSVEIDVLVSKANLLNEDNATILGLLLWPCFFIILILIFGGLNNIRESRERSKPIYRKIEIYEAALDRYKQTNDQYWKSLRGIAFETALANLYGKMGYWVHQTKGSGDEGIDLVLEKEGVKTVVQCKGHAKPIGVGAVRDLYGAMMHFGVPSAVLACPAGFTEGVIHFVMNKPIRLISASEIIEMAESVNHKE